MLARLTRHLATATAATAKTQSSSSSSSSSSNANSSGHNSSSSGARRRAASDVHTQRRQHTTVAKGAGKQALKPPAQGRATRDQSTIANGRSREKSTASRPTVKKQSTSTAPARTDIQTTDDTLVSTSLRSPSRRRAAPKAESDAVATAEQAPKRCRGGRPTDSVKLEYELAPHAPAAVTPPPVSPVKVKPEAGGADEGNSPTTPKRPPSPKRFGSPIPLSRPAPAHWRETFEAIRAMRELEPAPVDTVGCAHLASRAHGEKVFRFQTLVALMLSSQTKDPVTAQAMTNLKAHGLTVANLLKTSPKVLDGLISKVGFHNRKTIYLLETAKILHEQYDDDIPDTLEKLVELPGVGPKMAFLTLQVAWKKTDGIGVDVHVHRIANRLRWVRTEDASDGPEATRKGGATGERRTAVQELQAWLPPEHWEEINPLLVGFGQTVCTPVKPQCFRCSLNMTCPSSTVKRTLVALDSARRRAEAMKLEAVKVEEHLGP